MARKPKQESPPPDSFKVMFTALSVILLAFFILLNSMSTMDGERTRKALGSLTKKFVGLGSGPLFPRADSLVQIGEELALLADGPGKNMKRTVDDILKKEGLNQEVDVVRDGDDLLLVLPGSVLFDSGSAVLKPVMGEILQVVAGILKKTIHPVVVEGHTDDQPINTAIFPSNWELSTARAGAVVRYLIEKFDIKPNRISGVGYAEYRPIADNTTPEGRAKNRRVVIRFVGMGKETGEGRNALVPSDVPATGG